jgi:hypothetical protein
MERSAPIKKWLWIRRIIRSLTILIVVLVWTQDYWQQHFDHWRCGRMAAQLTDKYGLVVRYEDPKEFYVPPRPVIDYEKYEMEIEHVSAHSCLLALKGIRAGLKRYPRFLLRKYISAIFISGVFKNNGIQGAGTYAYSWIFVSATPVFDQLGSNYYAETLHHELSSLIIKKTDFPVVQWINRNKPDFKYLDNHNEVLQASAPSSRRNVEEAPLWHEAGFVHDYGMSSLENDFNTYAELAMTHPEQLKQLADQYPRIKAKTRILARFYSSLAPELKQYFEQAGLTFRE